MPFGKMEKQQIKKELAACLGGEREVRKIIIFGSFLTSNNPHDLELAVFQDSDESYLPLALKYRQLTRPIARRIPIDILPVRRQGASGWFMDEINRGEVVYER